jgi:hypothetical protein
MRKIVIEVIPHGEQRYPTCGDWFILKDRDVSGMLNKESLEIRVSDTGSDKSNMLVAVHELVEALLCLAHGITPQDVDHWDMNVKHDSDEPGDDPNAPYHYQHRAADIVERMMALEFGVSWVLHEENIKRLEP